MIQSHNYPGTLCVIEGIDGSGKTTVINNLQKLFQTNAIQPIFTKEPGATQLGIQIRHMLLEQTTPMCPKAEFLLFAADRAQHFETTIIPNLKQGNFIISDRMADSSLAYQGYVKGIDLDMIKTINSWCMDNITPDLVFYLSIDAKTSLDRIKASRGIPNKFEETIVAKITQLIYGFETIFQNRSNVIIINALLPADQVAQQIFEHILIYHTQKNHADNQ